METVSSIFLAVWLTLSGLLGIQAEPELGTLSVLKASQGGTGVGTATPSDVGKVLKVSDDSPFTYTLQDDNTGAGGSFPFTPTSYGNSTSSVLGLLGGVFSNASSTFHILKAGSASTTNLTVSSLNSANCDVKASSDGTFSCGTDATGSGGGTASVSTSSSETSGRVPFWTSTNGTPAQLSGGVAGFAWNDTFKRLTATYSSSTVSSATTFYGALVGNSDTATALAADPANCSAGNAPLGIIASGAVEGCFDVWTEAENTSAGYVAGTRALTIAGTANQITSSAGSQNLTADRTWTLSLPNHVIFPGSYVANSGTTTNATSTNFGGSFFTAIGSSGLDFHSSNGTSVLQLGAGAGSNASFFGGVNIDGTTRLATSLTGILKATAGTVSVATAGTDYANFAYPFTPATSWFSTSTISLNTAGLISTASSTIHLLRSGYATLTYSSTTYATSDTASTTSFFGAMLRNCTSNNVLTWSNGTFGCEADDTGAGGGSWPFITTATNYNTPTQSTSTPLWLRGSPYSLFASSTSVFEYASTTGALSTDLILAGNSANTVSIYPRGLSGGGWDIYDAPTETQVDFANASFGFRMYGATNGTFMRLAEGLGVKEFKVDFTPSNPSYLIGAGNFGFGSSTPGTKLSVNGNGGFSGDLYARTFLATSTTPSTFPYASSTAISAPTICVGSDCRTVWPAGGSTDTMLWSNASTSPLSVLSLNANSSSSIAFLSMTRATSTDLFSTNATTTQQYVGTHLYSPGTTRINVNSGLLSTGATGVIQNTTISSPLGFAANTLSCATCATFEFPFTSATLWTATSTLMLNTGGFMSAASSTLHLLRSGYASLTYSSTTYATTETASTTLFFGAMLRNCNSNNVLTWTNGVFGCEADDVGGGGSTDTVEWAEASTSNWAPLSLITLSSSTIHKFNSTYASSTDLTARRIYAPTGTGLDVFLSSGNDFVIQVGATDFSGTYFDLGDDYFQVGTQSEAYRFAAGAVNGIFDFSGLSATSKTFTFPNSTGTVCLTTTCAAFSYPFTPATNWFSTSTISLNTAGLISTASSSISFLDMVRSTSTDSISTNATTSILSASSHIRSQGTLQVDNLTSALVLTGATGLAAEYTGAACTNQVIEDLDALGAPTCRTITSAYVDSTISTFGYPFTPATSWTATSTLMLNTGGFMSVASSTLTNLFSNNLSIASNGTLVIPASASPVVNATGEIALDTTSGNIIFATSTAQALVLGGATTTLYAMVIASTSPDFASGGVIPLPTHFLKQQAVGIICKVDAGTSQQIFLSDSGSTNDTNTITCSTTETQYNFTTNNIWTAYEPIQLEFGTKSGSPDYVTIRIVGFRTSD